MKIYLFLLFTCISIVLFAQDEVAEITVQKFLIDFNSGKYENIYTTFSSEFKSKITKNETVQYLSKIHKMVSGFKSVKLKFKKDTNFYYYFVCNDENINADFLCSINSDGKFDFLTFKRIGGSGNPPAVEKLSH